jgi:uncharacterized membrane protein YhfC
MNIRVVTYALSSLLMIAIPVGLAFFLTRRWQMGWGVWWIGFATFIISQVGHIPFNSLMTSLLNKSGLVYWPQTWQLLFSAVFLGLSAGIFEEVSRYLVLHFWAKKARSWRNGVMFGAGHGASEAIIFGGLALLGFVNMLIVRSMDLSTLVSADQLTLAQQQLAAYWSAPWYSSLLGAVERVFAITCHIFMATLVMRAFTHKNIAWLFAAIGFHTLLDGVAVFCQPYVSVYVLEAIVGGFAVVSLILTFVLRKPEPQPEPEPVPGMAEVPLLKPVEETPEKLADSRYQKLNFPLR